MSPTKFRFMQHNALEALLQKHRYEAINAFILGDLSCIDPNFGTSLCQSFALFAVNTHYELIAALEDKGLLEKAKAMVVEYNKFVSKKTVNQMKTVADVWGEKPPSSHYRNMFNEITMILGEELVEFAGLCVTLTAASSLSHDEIEIVFSRRPMTPYFVSTPEAEASGDRNDGLDKEPEMRAKASDYIHNYMIQCAHNLKREDYNLFSQLAAATKQMTATVHNPGGGREMPVISTFNSMLLILADQWQRGHLIGERIRRSTAKSDTEGKEDDEPRFVHRFNDATVILWKPNKVTGRFERVPTTNENNNTPCVIFDALSVLSFDSPGEGLLSPDLDVFMQAVDQVGLETRVLVAVAGHNQFMPGATPARIDYNNIYEECCQQQQQQQHYTVIFNGIQGLSFAPDKNSISLSSLYNGCRLAAESAGLLNYKAIRRGASSGDVYTRNGQCVSTIYEHVYPATAAQLQLRCNSIKDRHERAGYPLYGGFIVRVGHFCRSLRFASDAASVNNHRSSNRRMKEHKKIHPELDAFYTGGVPQDYQTQPVGL